MQMCKCADCGYLSIRKLDSNVLVEVIAGTRKTWTMPEIPGKSQYSQFDPCPVCFVQAANLLEEARSSPAKDAVLPVITRDRNCSGFIKWCPGYSPKEHREMAMQIELAKLHEEQREKDRRFQDEQREKDRKWQESQAGINRKWQLRVALIGPLLGALLAGLGWVLGKLVR
jgi:hypothetical protein